MRETQTLQATQPEITLASHQVVDQRQVRALVRIYQAFSVPPASPTPIPALSRRILTIHWKGSFASWESLVAPPPPELDRACGRRQLYLLAQRDRTRNSRSVAGTASRLDSMDSCILRYPSRSPRRSLVMRKPASHWYRRRVPVGIRFASSPKVGRQCQSSSFHFTTLSCQ